MRQTASQTRIATPRLTGRAHLASRRLGAWLLTATPLLALLAFAPRAHAQFPSGDLGFSYTQQRSKFVGSSSTDYFYLRGASIDYGYTFFHGIGGVAAGNGMAVTNLRKQIDIHQASLMGGIRYTYNRGHITPTIWNRRGGIFAEGLVGLTLATDGEYPDGNHLNSSASGFTYAFGGGINYNLYHALDLRLMSHYFITDLPNGGTNQQKNIQVSAGINFHFGN
jgi:hypothetical protein